MCDDFGVNNGGATPGIGGTEKASDGVPAGKRRWLGDFAGRYSVAFGWGVIPIRNILGNFFLGGGPTTLNLWLKSGDTNEGGGIGTVGNGSGILLSGLKKQKNKQFFPFRLYT